MKKYFRFFAAGACCLLLSATLTYAADDTDLTVTELQFRDSIGKDIVWFDRYDLGGNIGTGTFVYNDAAGTNSANTDGVVEARNYSEDMTIQISIPTLGSTDIDVRLEGRAGTGTSWGLINTQNFSVATTIDHLMTAPAGTPTNYLEEIRVGARANGTPGTDTLTITGIIRGKRN